MVKLWFETSYWDFASGLRKPVVRLLAHAECRLRAGGWTGPITGIVDTGGPFSVLPAALWRHLAVVIHEENAWLQGISRRRGCRVAASLGTVSLRLVDQEGHRSEELEVMAYLVKRAQAPVILGFADLLEKYPLHADYLAQEAWLGTSLG